MNKLLVACALLVVGAPAFAGVGIPPTPVPEPGTLLMVALAAVIGVVARRGKK